MAIPVLTGRKTEAEKFAGANHTYCIEAMMGDKRALQSGTTHNLGQNFAKAFDVKYQTSDNREEYVYATSWGVSTRLIGAVIMVHGDDKGLRLPPKIAPIQVVVIPIARNDRQKADIKRYISKSFEQLVSMGIRIHEDWREESPGFKFNDWEMRGVPLRIEVGPRDIEQRNVVLVRRDTAEKIIIKLDDLIDQLPALLEDIQQELFDRAQSFRDMNTRQVDTYEDFKKIIKDSGGFIKCGWDGNPDTEAAIKEETKATIRCIPFDEKPEGKRCIYSGKKAKHEVIFAKAY